MEARLALLTFSVLPLMVLATVDLYPLRARGLSRDREKVGAVVGDLAENIGGMRVIQAFAQEANDARSVSRRSTAPTGTPTSMRQSLSFPLCRWSTSERVGDRASSSGWAGSWWPAGR